MKVFVIFLLMLLCSSPTFLINKYNASFKSNLPLEEDLYLNKSYINKKNIKIAIIDSEINFSHPFLKERLKGRFKTIFTKRASTLSNSHGTMVAGVITKYVPESTIISIVIPPDTRIPDLVEAIDIAKSENVDIINISLTTYKNDPYLKKAIQSAIEQGVLIICSTGNDSIEVNSYPASYPGVISVANITQSHILSDYSNINENTTIATLGEDISTIGIGEHGQFIYTKFSGTSASTPIVTAFVALFKMIEDSKISSSEMISLLRESSDTIFDSRRKINFYVLNPKKAIYRWRTMKIEKEIFDYPYMYYNFNLYRHYYFGS
ncbi:S8 family peptidase [Aneurinibacillus migulanus]|uniref:S8 family peptidase n=1 Tax=Aneurinibacillus migulanus TaxID=47500 RepID=UPI00209F04BD|nr:S8 family serine peptidase [Aneurinibacillus migulanus]MCP1355343.1 S8 family serine peptidase [Aneurinibacillus migulanus]